MEDAIELRGLTKHYGSRRGLAGLSLTVRSGEVLGYLGPNGAGKTTTIRLLLDLIRPTSGTLRVLGLDPRADSAELHRRIGYLAGDFVVDGRQSVAECLRFLGNLRGGVPAARVEELAGFLGLDLAAKIKSLSKGNRQKIGLVQAFMHQPELLILDEPTAGLDPLVQQTFLDMIRQARGDGQTVFMSSHIISEVQAVADRVAIIRDGELVALETVTDLRSRSYTTVEITFAEAVSGAAFAALPGIRDLTTEPAPGGGTVLRCRVTGGGPDALIKAAARYTIAGLRTDQPGLKDLFYGYYAGKEHGRAA